MKILVTGGASFVGSAVCSALIDHGYSVVILDMVNEENCNFVKDKTFYNGEISDSNLIKEIFHNHSDIEFTIHCAEKVAVEQSVTNPYEYYHDNVVNSMELFKLVYDLGCKKIIFNSSGAVYDVVPGYMVTETSPVNPRSPFARSKLMTEMILKDYCNAYDLKCISLRSFNSVGADPKIRFGMQTKSRYNLIGKLLQVAYDYNQSFKIAGKDWGTRDGTCIRDYVHVWDVAMAFVKAVKNFDTAFKKAETQIKDKGHLTINVGSGVGVTVKEFIFAFENVTGEKIKVTYDEHRAGDVAGSYANITRAKSLIDWTTKFTLEEAILDAIRWEETKD